MSSKNLPPSQKRLRQAAHDGKFAKSSRMTAALGTLGACCGLTMTASESGLRLQSWMSQMIADPPAASQALLQSLHISAWILGAPALGGLIGVLSAQLVQVGIHIRPHWVAPKFDR